MKAKPKANDAALARRVLARLGTVEAQIAELSGRYGWGLARIARALGLRPLQVLRRAGATPRGGPRSTRRVHCRRCGWTGRRPRSTATLRPCPRCDHGVRLGRGRLGGPTVAERRGLEVVVDVVAHVDPTTYAVLRGTAGRLLRDAAGLVLDRWARGEPIPAGWRPPVRESTVGRTEAGTAVPTKRLQ